MKLAPIVSLAVLAAAPQVRQSPALHVASPNNLLTFSAARGSDGGATYSVTMRGGTVIEPSSAGVVVNGMNLGERVEMFNIKDGGLIDERYAWLGVHSTAVNRCRASA